MHDCPFRLVEEGNIRCQKHIDIGIIDALLTPGVCQRCQFLQDNFIELEAASLRMLNNYILQTVPAISVMSREDALEAFTRSFVVITKIYKKENATDFLSNMLEKLATNPYIFEKDLEEAYEKVRGFEENT